MSDAPCDKRLFLVIDHIQGEKLCRRLNRVVQFTSLDPVKTRCGQRTPVGVIWRPLGRGMFMFVFPD